jgi:hypothetical protein
MAKKLVPVSTGSVAGGVKKPIALAPKRDANLTDADCICATMKPHCPVHSTVKQIPAPGQDVIR